MFPLFQISFLSRLLDGVYDGLISVKQLKEKGDFGVGTFDAIDGEMIVLDGIVYKAKGNGTVEIADDKETVPFANVTFFENSKSYAISKIENYESLIQKLNEIISPKMNRFYVIKLSGAFSKIKVRSEYKQVKPFKPLAVVMKTDETIFDYENLDGDLVGLFCPNFMSSLNSTGWHFHFISNDKQKGGHIIELKMENAKFEFHEIDELELKN